MGRLTRRIGAALRRLRPRADFAWRFEESGPRATLALRGARPVAFDLAHEPVRDWLRKKHADGAMHEPTFAFVLLELLRRLEPAVYFDVGALYGYFTLLPAAARPGLAVHSFEMNPRTFAGLSRNVAANPELAPAIRPVNAALSGAVAPRSRIWYSGMALRDSPAEGFEEAAVDVLTLDHLAFERGPAPDLLKIDVEGFEAPVLRGAERLLRERRPALLYELHKDAMLERHGATRASVTQLLLDRGYQVFALDQHREQYVTARPLQRVVDARHRAVARQRSHSFVALPPALAPRLDGLVRG